MGGQITLGTYTYHPSPLFKALSTGNSSFTSKSLVYSKNEPFDYIFYFDILGKQQRYILKIHLLLQNLWCTMRLKSRVSAFTLKSLLYSKNEPLDFIFYYNIFGKLQG